MISVNVSRPKIALLKKNAKGFIDVGVKFRQLNWIQEVQFK